MKKLNIVIVGAGLTSAVIARELVESSDNIFVTVFEKRNHIGGNCYEEKIHDIKIHKYGPHLFHTNNEKVFKWLSRFTEWIEYKHKVKAMLSNGRLVTLPVNKETKEIVGEENVLDIFFRPYTRKMWNKEIEQLSPDIVNRVPVRDDLNDLYFPNDKYQALPKNGYNFMIKNIFDHPRIEIKLSTAINFEKLAQYDFDHAFLSVPIDEFFNYKFGELPYRSIKFEHQKVNVPILFPVTTVNFTHDGPKTRITEWKNLPNQKCKNLLHTVITTEEPCDFKDNNNERYYPVKDVSGSNLEIYKLYDKYVKQNFQNLTFTGRLGKYVYINMDQCVNIGINDAKLFLKHHID